MRIMIALLIVKTIKITALTTIRRMIMIIILTKIIITVSTSSTFQN